MSNEVIVRLSTARGLYDVGEGPIPDITLLSLRVRLAIALRLFAGYCERRGLAHAKVDAYLEYLWRFIGMPCSSSAFG